MSTLYVLSVWLHVVAACSWVGSMIFFATVVVPVLHRDDVQTFGPRLLRVLGARFRVLAWTSLAVLVLTGISNLSLRGIGLEALCQSSLWRTSFGRALGWKLGFVGITIAVTAAHELSTRQGPDGEVSAVQARRARRVASWIGRSIMLASLFHPLLRRRARPRILLSLQRRAPTIPARKGPASVSSLLPLLGDLPSRSMPAVARKGFRPFFLLAAAFAVIIVPSWALVFLGVVDPGTYLDPIGWHAHEMVFGFAVAVISGFLLTAVANWTKRETLVGAPLLALAALWVLGRLAMAFAGVLPRGAPASIDLAFLPALMLSLARPLFAAKDRRNLVMLGVLGALFAANVVVHLDALGVTVGSARRALLLAIDIIVLLTSVIAGRVFPMFTRNASGVASIRSSPALDIGANVILAAMAAMDLVAPNHAGAGVVAGAAGVLTAARAARWGTRHAFRDPLLWILHAGYAWIPIGLVLRAAAVFAPAIVARSLATHALTVGAIGSLTLGMMARVSLGHTGRTLAASRPLAWAFGAITAAACARAAVPLFAPGWYRAAVLAAAGLWTLAFLLYLLLYVPILARPRVDGKPG